MNYNSNIPPAFARPYAGDTIIFHKGGTTQNKMAVNSRQTKAPAGKTRPKKQPIKKAPPAKAKIQPLNQNHKNAASVLNTDGRGAPAYNKQNTPQRQPNSRGTANAAAPNFKKAGSSENIKTRASAARTAPAAGRQAGPQNLKTAARTNVNYKSNNPALNNPQIKKNAPQRSSNANAAKNAPPKRKLTAEEAEALRKKREAYLKKKAEYKKKQKEYAIKLIKEKLRVLFWRSLVFFAMFILLFLMTSGIFFINLISGHTVKAVDYTIQTGSDYDTASVKKVLRDYIYRNGSYYINITSIASYCEFTTTGDIKELRFISKSEGNDNVRFEIGGGLIYVNGVRARLMSPVVRENDGIYVPVEFFQKYTSGINVTVDSENKKIIVSRAFDQTTAETIEAFEKENALRQAKGEDELDISELELKPAYLNIKFTLHSDESTDHIDEYSIGKDLLELTDPYNVKNAQNAAPVDITAGG